jgi:predicted RNA-binding protein with PUA-like domain
VGYVETFKSGITLEQLKAEFEPDELWVVRRGNRLSVMPIEEPVARKLLNLARKA